MSGPSGTGKSTVALTFSYKHHIPAIIDDGLLIVNGKKVAGFSAKYEKNSFTAVKRAIFHFNDHAQEVRTALRKLNVHKLLIIGTSDKMVDFIALRLGIPSINHYIHIDEIRTLTQIKMAQYVRKTEGKHVIPIPHNQIDQNFFRKIIKQGIKILSPNNEVMGETTVVTPHFHPDSIHISSKTLEQIIKRQCESVTEVIRCKKIIINMLTLPTVKITVELSYPNKHSIKSISETVQHRINQGFQQHLQLDLDSIDIYVTKLRNLNKKKSFF
ncbi:hypothetical protein [Bacillus bingmayongensis]|uniref:hypothetical protein n=1 Tax=Bacillus bingmayongensis TaxID=1150157 RepID=UPI00030F0213|nr:hypothetical protein [Bacillus bingmayongensis]